MPNQHTIPTIRPIVRPIGPSIAYIPLNRGLFSLIDVDDIDLCQGNNWMLYQSGISGPYAVKTSKFHDFLHRILLGFTKGDGRLVDHKSGNTLDNRRCNLRESNRIQNSANARRKKLPKSGHVGVYRVRGTNKPWAAKIRNKFIGSFATPEEAHQAYCRKSIEIFGEFSPVRMYRND